jgi:formyltetrahydrofolate synthetase
MITNNIGRFASDQQFFSQTKTSQGPFLGVLSGATGVGMATVRVTE